MRCRIEAEGIKGLYMDIPFRSSLLGFEYVNLELDSKYNSLSRSQIPQKLRVRFKDSLSDVALIAKPTNLS